jgi:NTE family protein
VCPPVAHPSQQTLSSQLDGHQGRDHLPDGNSREAFGDNMMDLSRRPRTARAGYDQGSALAGQLTDFWR